MNYKNKIAIVLYSGGMDSTACLYWAKEMKYSKIIAFSIDYAHTEIETLKQAASYYCEKVDSEWMLEYSPFLAFMTDKVKCALSGPEVGDKTDVKSTWVPARNTFLIAHAIVLADTLDKPVDIILGANATEGADYPDNSPAFINFINLVAEMGTLRNKVNVIAPFVNNTKAEIITKMNEIGADLSGSFSCYNPKKAKNNHFLFHHCGTCLSCINRKEAFILAKVEDPTNYVE